MLSTVDQIAAACTACIFDDRIDEIIDQRACKDGWFCKFVILIIYRARTAARKAAVCIAVAFNYPAGPLSSKIGPNISQRSPLNFIICNCLFTR